MFCKIYTNTKRFLRKLNSSIITKSFNIEEKKRDRWRKRERERERERERNLEVLTNKIIEGY